MLIEGSRVESSRDLLTENFQLGLHSLLYDVNSFGLLIYSLVWAHSYGNVCTRHIGAYVERPCFGYIKEFALRN